MSKVRTRDRGPAARPGFTLIEMMVSVTLVLIMMTMFAQVFQMAGGSISKQRGMAENDQRARTLQTIIKADLDKRSFRWVFPFAVDEDLSQPESYASKRQGYFYVSENNPYNGMEDVLQFTVVSTIKDRNKDETPYYGQALNFSDPSNFFGADKPSPSNSFGYPNQPDADDAQLTVNNTGLSTVAEISYFVRNGNLYRRQLLVREPLAAAGSNPQPTDAKFNRPNGRDVFDASVTADFHYTATGPFWRDFDYAAYYDPNTSSAKFLGSDALDNTTPTAANVLAAPFRRFGHHHFDTGSPLYSGRPKEFASSDNSLPEFMYAIGRYTLQECSDTDFRYPQYSTTAGNFPMSPALNLTLDANDASVVGPDDLSNGSRRGEDLLLPNVHAFDILVWDAGYGGFVNIGDPTLPATADFAMSKRQNASYGPRLPATESLPTVANACFDTWHPKIDLDNDTVKEAPPFRPLRTTTAPNWVTGTTYNVGDEVFPNVAAVQEGYPFFYRCINGSTGTGGSVPLATHWPRAAGLTFPDSNGATWQAVDNRKPLKAIKLEIRYVDPSTQQMRQLTIIHSLVD